eukprot:scaffold4658_cov118-Cylindrotheca_fusiformis.AAC.5
MASQQQQQKCRRPIVVHQRPKSVVVINAIIFCYSYLLLMMNLKGDGAGSVVDGLCLSHHRLFFHGDNKKNQYSSLFHHDQHGDPIKARSLSARHLQFLSTLKRQRKRRRKSVIPAKQQEQEEEDQLVERNQRSNINRPIIRVVVGDLVQMMRPVTILQAVGALVVGRLALISSSSSLSIASTSTTTTQLLLTSISVYLSYGAGMVMNDVMDANMDAMHNDKLHRPIPSGRIMQWQGWMFCGFLCTLSILLAHVAATTKTTMSNLSLLVQWTLSNIVIMLGYALGLQRLLIIKNILCGWLAISPLVGASLLNNGSIGGGRPLVLLAMAGFPLQVAREILKDAEDVDIDKGQKKTIPLMMGVESSRRLAYTLVFGVLSGMILTPYYWTMFGVVVSSNATMTTTLYPLSVLVGSVMCIRASQLNLNDGQKLLKKSIYILLAGMIGSLIFSPTTTKQ